MDYDSQKSDFIIQLKGPIIIFKRKFPYSKSPLLPPKVHFNFKGVGKLGTQKDDQS